MREAREEMLQSLNESNLEKMRKAAKGAKQTLKMKDGSIGMDSFTASAIMQIYDKVNDKNKKTMENLLKDGKKADIVKLMKFAMSKVNAEYVPEESELDEASYALYHKDFSSAMQHSYKMAKKMYGITIDPKEIDDKVASGPRKPSEGKTNKYRLKGDKGAIQVQVYNKGGSKPFELNMYKEEVELDEAKIAKKVPAKGGGHFIVLHRDTKGMSGKQDKFLMRTLNKGKVTDYGTHVSVDRALGFAKNKGIIEDAELAEKLDKEDEPTVKKVVKMLKKASGAHAGQAKDLEKAVTEGDEIEEGKMSQLHQLMKDGKSAKEIAKIMKLDVKTIKALVGESAGADARRAMRGDPDMRQRAFSKDDSATDDERKAASKNIMMQMRKAVSLRSFDVEFADGKKVKIPQKVAQSVLQKYNSFRKPADKEKYQAKVGKSYKDMLAALKEGFASDAQRRAAFAQGYKAKGKKDKKESTLERMNKKIQEKKNG